VNAIRTFPVFAMLVIALLSPCACAASSGKRGGRHGPALPTLPDGTPVEPSTYRAETTESAEILGSGILDWELDLVGGSVDRIGALRASTLEWLQGEVRRGFGDGFELSARAESWNQTVVGQGASAQNVVESGTGTTTVTLRRRLRAGGISGPSACAGFHVRIPGAANGPGPRVVEAGLFVPISFPLGRQSRLAAMVEGDVIPDALDSGRHVEGISSLELTREIDGRLSARCEAVSVWNGDAGRPWLGTVNAGVSFDLLSHIGITMGASAGNSGGVNDLGGFGRLSVHP